MPEFAAAVAEDEEEAVRLVEWFLTTALQCGATSWSITIATANINFEVQRVIILFLLFVKFSCGILY